MNTIRRTAVEILRLRRAAELVGSILRSVSPFVRVGETPTAIDLFCRDELHRVSARTAADLNLHPCATSISVNNVAVHGIPGEQPLMDGDVFTLDVACELDGWMGDGAWTYGVGNVSSDRRRLISAAWKATRAGILAVGAGGNTGDIGRAVEAEARRSGCVVLPGFVGHGIGSRLHEPPAIPNIGRATGGVPIEVGMVFTIEPILALKMTEPTLMDDGWSYACLDGTLTAQFEHTVAVLPDRIDVLTFPGGFLPELPPW